MKVLKVIIVIALVAMLFATPNIARAQATLPPICSGVQLQNKGTTTANPVKLYFYHQGDNDGIADYEFTVPDGGIAPNVSKSYYIPNLLPGTVPSGAYSVVTSSSQPLNSLVNQVDCDLVAPRVGGSHSGFEGRDIGKTLYLGYVMSRAFLASWSSALAVQNAGSSTATNVRIDFYRSGESTPAETFTNTNLKVGETWYLDLSTGIYATANLNGFAGTAKITSDQDVAAVANYAPSNGSRMLSYNGTVLKSQKLYASQMMKHYTVDDYTGGFVLYNPNGSSTPISYKFYQTGSTTPVCTINDSIAANASYVKYVGSISACTTGTLSDGYNGYMVVEVTSGSNQILGIFNFDSAAGQAGAANMMTLEQASTVLYFPQIVRNYSGFQSGWQIVNTTNTDLKVYVEYYKTDGTLTWTMPTRDLFKNTNLTIYVGDTAHSPLGDGWNGGAKVIVQGAAGGIVGQANFVQLGIVDTLLIYNGFAP